MRDNFPHIFSNITLGDPSPCFSDKTLNIKEWTLDINSYLLSRLARTSNKYLLPTIKCPWGCSEFQHKVGYLPVDIMLQCILQKAYFNTYSTKSDADKYVSSICEDYVRDEGDEEILFFNHKWKVLPSIAFVPEKGPVVLTCNEHDGGTKSLFVHPCSWQHNLPSRRPDQLCQAVLQPRILKPVKASKYSTSFQMFHQSGTFNGIDTCSTANFGNFDFTSKLSRESEARSIIHRPDINAHLTHLRKEGHISEFVKTGRRAFAMDFASSVDFARFSKGATYVPLQSSIIL